MMPTREEQRVVELQNEAIRAQADVMAKKEDLRTARKTLSFLLGSLNEAKITLEVSRAPMNAEEPPEG